MTFKELKKKSVSELHSFLADNRNKLRELRFKDASQQLKTVRDIRKIRQEIAQALTLLNAKNQTNKEAKAEVKIVKEEIVKPAVEEKTEAEKVDDKKENK